MHSIVKLLKEPTNRRKLLTSRSEKRFAAQAKKQGGRMVDLGVPTEVDPFLEKKREIVAIEGMFMAINSATYSIRFMDSLRNGLEYIGSIHARLIKEIGPEEVEKMRKAAAPPAPLVN